VGIQCKLDVIETTVETTVSVGLQCDINESVVNPVFPVSSSTPLRWLCSFFLLL